jgi:hypothetical protein
MTYITCQWVNAVGCIAQVLGPTNAVHAGANRDQAGRAAPATDVLNETLERLHLLLRDLALAWHVDRQGLGRVINGLRVAAVPQREPPR